MHILWVHNSSSILLSQTFEFLNTSANYKDATGNMFVNAYWSWSPIYFLWLWRVWVVYIYIIYHKLYFVCLFLWSIIKKTSLFVARAVAKQRASLPTCWQTCWERITGRHGWFAMWQCAFWLFFCFKIACLLIQTHLQEIRQKNIKKSLFQKLTLLPWLQNEVPYLKHTSNKKVITSWLPVTSLVCFSNCWNGIRFICQRSSTPPG